jgi:PBP1b-binding outer membrane lipoprotein LpoB
MRHVLITLRTFFQVAALLSLMFLLISCSGVKVKNTSQEEIAPLSCVAVLPTAAGYKSGMQEEDEREELRGGVSSLQSAVDAELQKSNVSRVVDPSMLQRGTGEVTGGRLGAIKEIGRHLQCEAVLVSTLNRFKRRQGTKYSVDEPASVAFELKLVDTRTGQSLWMSNFNETQQSLLSNMFSFGKAKSRGFTWVTAEELLAGGVHEKLRKCPYIYE